MFDFDVSTEERDFVDLLRKFLIGWFVLSYRKLLNILGVP